MINSVANGCDLTCDIPGCDTSTHITSEVLRADALCIRDAYAVARQAAETNFGWFNERIESERTCRTLQRDICPKHASGYRTLLGMGNSNNGKAHRP